MTKESALVVRITDDGSDYFLNMENQCLLTELKGIKDKNKIALTKARYKYSMALLGMSVVSHYKNISDTDIDVSDEVKKISSMIAPTFPEFLSTIWYVIESPGRFKFAFILALVPLTLGDDTLLAPPTAVPFVILAKCTFHDEVMLPVALMFNCVANKA